MRRFSPKAASAKVRCVFRRNYGSLTIDGPLSETSRWRAVARVLRSPLDAMGSTLLPDSCALCGSPLPHFSSIPNCEACWTEIPVHHGSVRARCCSDPSEVEGRRILQDNDIPSTAATARAAAQSLIKAGAAVLYVATLVCVRPIHLNSAQPHVFEMVHAQPGFEPAKQFAGMHSSSSTHQLS